jgi:uncharacterized zinc-type alcohol dehydrogenase-like protein
VIKAYAAHETNAPLKPFALKRREPGAADIQIEILYCGVCHSDLHSVNGDWGAVNSPLVPGHEIVGRVEKAGAKAGKFKVGDMVGVGCLVDSCRQCASCREGLEQYCEGEKTFTYNSPDKISGGITQGGYSAKIVVDEKYVVRVPSNIPPEKAAPLLCAGITTYSPMRHWNLQKGQKLGVAGLGGLGHMAVKIGVAMGAEVTVLSTSEGKRDDAKKLGAHDFAVTKDPADLRRVMNRFDLILNTISAEHDYNQYLNMLKRDGTMVLLGLPGPQPVAAFSLVPQRKNLAGSMIGGIAETQEMLNFCSEHGITPEIEMIKMGEINDAFKRLLKNDVHYRFVIDMATLQA